MGPLGQEWVGGVPVVVPDTVGIVSAAGASWGRTEGSQWWAGSNSEGSNTMPHSQQAPSQILLGHQSCQDSNASLNHFSLSTWRKNYSWIMKNHHFSLFEIKEFDVRCNNTLTSRR